jgi:hypothetical protein
MKEKDRISEVEDQDRLKSLLKSGFNTHEGHPGLRAALWVCTLVRWRRVKIHA